MSTDNNNTNSGEYTTKEIVALVERLNSGYNKLTEKLIKAINVVDGVKSNYEESKKIYDDLSSWKGLLKNQSKYIVITIAVISVASIVCLSDCVHLQFGEFIVKKGCVN